jgi:primosomal protein N'
MEKTPKERVYEEIRASEARITEKKLEKLETIIERNLETAFKKRLSPMLIKRTEEERRELKEILAQAHRRGYAASLKLYAETAFEEQKK